MKTIDQITYTPQQVLEELRALISQEGDRVYAEGVNFKEHMIQCAALARAAGYENDMIVSAFLHEIGALLTKSYIVCDWPETSAEAYAMRYLSTRGFSKKVRLLARSHTDALRYLLCRDGAYKHLLTSAQYQAILRLGGPMSMSEAFAFEAEPYFESKIIIRKWDDRGKTKQLFYPEGVLERYLIEVEKNLIDRRQNL